MRNKKQSEEDNDSLDNEVSERKKCLDSKKRRKAQRALKRSFE